MTGFRSIGAAMVLCAGFAPAAQAESSCSSVALCETECDNGGAQGCTKAGALSAKSDAAAAVRFFQRGCDAGDGAGCLNLGLAYQDGTGVAADAQKAFRSFTRGCDKQHGPSCLGLARWHENTAASLNDAARVAQEMNQAASLFYKACESGGAAVAACTELSRLYLWGVGTRTDLAGGAAFAQRGCDGGDGRACRLVSALYEVGQGVPKDARRSADALKRIRGEDKEPTLVVPPMLQAGAPTLTIETDPPGQPVLVDGMFAGQAPTTLTLPQGEHLFEGGEAGRRVQVVGPGKNETLVLRVVGMLTVESEPPGATVIIDRASVGRTPWKGALSVGTHSVELEAAGFERSKRAVKVAGGSNGSERFALVSTQGSLVIDAQPDGATLLLDGLALGKTSWSGGVMPGVHALRVELSGYVPVTRQLIIKQGVASTEKVTLVQATYAVSLGSTPRGASVTIDGKTSGTTPWRGALTAGAHDVSLLLEGYQPVKETLTVANEGATNKDFALIAAPAAVTITTDPAGANVMIDGATVGVTPWQGELPPGKHPMVLELERYVRLSQPIAVTKGKPTTLRFALKQELGKLSVTSKPKGAALKLDDEPLGKTPWSGTVPTGAHRLSVTLEGYLPFDEPITVLPKGTLSKAVTLDVAPPPASISSTPSNAEVLIDGKKVGLTPWTGVLSTGMHQLTVSLGGYEPFVQNIDVGKTVPVTLGPVLKTMSAKVSVESVPPGATIVVDGANIAYAPSVMTLSLGKHRVQASLNGYEPREAELEVLGPTATWRLELKAKPSAVSPTVALDGGDASAPPMPPLVAADAPADSQELIKRRAAVLDDEKATLEQKRAAMKALAETQSDLTAFVDRVKPAAAREALCAEWGRRVFPVPVEVNALNSFDDELEGRLYVDGAEVANVPFSGQLATCSTHLEVRAVSEAGPMLEQRVQLSSTTKNKFVLRSQGRPRLWVFSLFGEYSPYSAVEGLALGDRFGGGLRIEHYGKAFHFSIGLKAASPTPDTPVILNNPVIPSGDLFFGLGTGVGNATTRLHVAVDVGLWSLFLPSARLTLALNVKDSFFVSLTGTGHAHPWVLLAPESRQSARIDARLLASDQYLFFSGSLALGGAF